MCHVQLVCYIVIHMCHVPHLSCPTTHVLCHVPAHKCKSCVMSKWSVKCVNHVQVVCQVHRHISCPCLVSSASVSPDASVCDCLTSLKTTWHVYTERCSISRDTQERCSISRDTQERCSISRDTHKALAASLHTPLYTHISTHTCIMP